MDRVDAVTQSIHNVEVNAMQFSAQMNKVTAALTDDFKITKLTLESRIDNYKLVADKVDM